MSATKPFSLLHPALLLAGLALTTAGGSTAAAQNNASIFGPNVYVLDPSMSPAAINAQLNSLNAEAQFSTNRYAILFKPGAYGTGANPVSAPVGFYESVAGLGQTPGQVTITGGLTADQLISGNMTQNFWRSQENLTEVPVGGLVNGVLDWGVSQGASLRRLNIQGGLTLTNSGSIGMVNPCAESSGGFTADTVVSGLTNACSQQQWYTRNSVLTGGFSANVWNFVFSGVLPTNVPAPSYPGGTNGDTNVTNLATTPVSREKPFLYLDSSGNYNVFVPTLKTNSSGTSWSGGGLGTGFSSPISSFFIATPSSTLAQINGALAAGKSLILTPGIYQYSGAINVTNANTVVLGMGYATLVPQAGTPAISVADVDGVQLAGLLIDAGPVNSPVLLQLGNPGTTNASHAANPTSVNDVFFRIGGGTLGSATTSLQVDSGNVILDNIWAWRADHGNAGTVGWTANTAAHGLVVNGDNVTALGLAVEHYQQSQVQWNGNGGETIFYQSELPYDPPSQSAWSSGTTNGYPSYAVAPTVCSHTAYGLGIYSFFNLGINIIEDNAMTVPNTAGINIKDVGTVFLNGSGQISNVISGTGGPASLTNHDVLVPVSNYVGTGTCSVAALPAAPTGLSAVNQPPQGAAVNPYVALLWNASTTPGVTYTIYRATGGGAPAAIKAGLTTTNYNDTTASPTTTYTYYVVAVNTAGSSAPSNSQTVTTGVAATPVAPTGLTAVAVSSSQINLSWTASGTPGVTYLVYRSPVASFVPSSSTLVGSAAGTTFNDLNLAAATTYSYYVEAMGPSGNSQPTNEATQTTLSAVAVVNPPTNLVATAVSASQINLTWTASTTPGVSYEIFGSANTAPTISEANLLASTAGTTYSATGLMAATPYYYAVIAVGGTTSAAARANATTLAAATTSDVTAIDVGSAVAVGSYLADTTCAAGAQYNPGQTVTIPAALTGTAAPEKVYESACQGARTYTIGGLVSGNSYTVVLHFAELYFASAGNRQFNVAINGTPVAGLQNFDIYAAAGNARFTAVIKSLANITAINGQIVIAFSNGAKDQPMINGIEVQGGTAGPAPPPPAAVAIDAGSTTAAGTYAADTTCNPGAIYNPGQTIAIPAAVASVAAPEKVYESACQGTSTYTLTGFAANSVHTVDLHFAELYFASAGSRLFNVAINGTPVAGLQNFDIFTAAGNARFTAVVKSIPNITAVNGQIVVSLTNGLKDQPMINGIAVQ